MNLHIFNWVNGQKLLIESGEFSAVSDALARAEALGLHTYEIETADGRNAAKTLAEIEAAYSLARDDQSVIWNGHTFRWHKPLHHADWAQLGIAAALGQSREWQTEEGVTLPLSPADIVEISNLKAGASYAAFQAYQAAKIQLTGA